MPAQAIAAAALLAFAQHGNRIDLTLDRGAAEVVWRSSSTFRFRRVLEGALPSIAAPAGNPVDVKCENTTSAVLIRSKYLEVTIRKQGGLVSVRRLDGKAPMVSDVTEPSQENGAVAWDRQGEANSHYFGLGRRAEMGLDLRGQAVDAETPFFISSAGYGEFHNGAGKLRVDFTAGDRYRISAPSVDYFFIYGPKPKEIFEERKDGPAVVLTADRPPAQGTWDTLRTSLLRLVSGAMSGDVAPAFDLTPYAQAPAELQARARQVGSLVTNATAGPLGLSGFRQQLKSFFDIYSIEVRDKAHPTWHALPFQFPDDPEGARHADEFMLGDEMLIAPIYTAGNKRELYLPQGVWTNLETNAVFQGRRTIQVDTAALPVYARNGMIVPLDSPGGMGLHYFPSAGGEFFLLEDDIGDYTQIHAAPAVDYMRLEIESKKDRDYQWVIHHVERPKQVGFEDTMYRPVTDLKSLGNRTWFYDAAQKNLNIRVHVKANEDCITNIDQ